ncbi:response regulator transcription factor [Leptospira ellisii]|uniref:Response regulator transcription factor n=1 Tax=Leptospira ellisii TaxID=2023197 RepID=A0AAE4QMQ5_9LEPT|nr:response regulator transcription factor [Leptospira ellisii]MDV6235818.1 response regulator transcription factor [Leptospira ellisii]PKA03910.1 DNA-binding response regulator [Leptospira ellisii]
MVGTPKTSIFLVDDHPVVRNGLSAEIEVEPDFLLAGSVASVKEAIRKLGFVKADLLVCDISLQEENGIQELETIKQKFPEIKIVFLTMHRDWTYLQKAFALGADGYLLKSQSMQEILSALREVADGGKVFPEEIKNFRPPADLRRELGNVVDLLTKREKEILLLLSLGKLNREIAEELDLSVRTVETHRASVFKKLKIENVIELGRISVQLKSEGLL